MATREAQRPWRLAVLAVILALAGCKDLTPSYIGGDIGAVSRPERQCAASAAARQYVQASRRAPSS
jgi:hypothetical protein